MPRTARRNAQILLPPCCLRGGGTIVWLKQRLITWVSRYQQREIECLLTENAQLKAELIHANGGQPICLPPEAQQRLNLLRQKLDPEVLKRIDQLTDSK